MARETILIFEDDADIRELIRYNLTREGYSIAECVSAANLTQTPMQANRKLAAIIHSDCIGNSIQTKPAFYLVTLCGVASQTSVLCRHLPGSAIMSLRALRDKTCVKKRN